MVSDVSSVCACSRSGLTSGRGVVLMPDALDRCARVTKSSRRSGRDSLARVIEKVVVEVAPLNVVTVAVAGLKLLPKFAAAMCR